MLSNCINLTTTIINQSPPNQIIRAMYCPITLNCAMDLVFGRDRNQSSYDFYNTTDLITIPPHGETIVDVRTIDKKRKFEMQFEVLNALTAPATHPVFRIQIRPKQ